MDTLFELPPPVKKPRSAPLVYNPKEFKLVELRDCPPPHEQTIMDRPELVERYWREAVETSPSIIPSVETCAILLLNTRRRLLGHTIASTGTLDSLLIHPREVFRIACIAAASAVILTHNHPSGDPTPSDADIKVTRDLIRAGLQLKIEVLDHVVIGHPRAERPYVSLRELGYFYGTS